MSRISFAALQMTLAMLADTWAQIPDRLDLAKAERKAARRHARHYGLAGKRMPTVMRAGSRPALRYAARIAAGKIPESQILRIA